MDNSAWCYISEVDMRKLRQSDCRLVQVVSELELWSPSLWNYKPTSPDTRDRKNLDLHSLNIFKAIDLKQTDIGEVKNEQCEDCETFNQKTGNIAVRNLNRFSSSESSFQTYNWKGQFGVQSQQKMKLEAWDWPDRQWVGSFQANSPSAGPRLGWEGPGCPAWTSRWRMRGGWSRWWVSTRWWSRLRNHSIILILADKIYRL